MTRISFPAMVISIAFFPLSMAGGAQSVTLAWDPSPQAAGYKLYYGTESGNYSESVDVGNVTTASVDALSDATTYYFAVTAYNAALTESSPSNEVAHTTAAPPPASHYLRVDYGSGDGSYLPGEQVIVTADPPPAGQEFDRWDGDKAILSNFLLSPTSATMVSQDVAITAIYRQRSGLPPRLIGAVSRKIHGNAGTFDIAIGIVQNAPGGVECRDGRSLMLVATFDKPITAGQVLVTAGRGTISGTPVFSGTTMTISVTNVPNVQILRLSLRNLRANDGGVLVSAIVEVRMLVGDVNGDRVVNKKDRDLVQKMQNAWVGASNFRGDLNVNGTLTSRDTALAVTYQGTSVP